MAGTRNSSDTLDIALVGKMTGPAPNRAVKGDSEQIRSRKDTNAERCPATALLVRAQLYIIMLTGGSEVYLPVANADLGSAEIDAQFLI